MSREIYSKTVFQRFFKENDPKVLAWAENVLAKICGPGILPTYLNKEGEDFKSFWGAITHLFALIVIYGRQYNEIDVNKILFELFIENRGLVTSEVNTQEQMQYLFNNYVKEYEKRGRLDIISKEGVIWGELLRLIQYQTLDEFIFALLSPRDSGWALGHSSPTWNRTDTVVNIIKGYETSRSVENINNYPLINPTGIVLVQDQDNEGSPIQAMTFVGDVLTGIGSTEDQSKLFIVSENLPYQVSCKVKVSDVVNQNITFGVQVYDELKRPISLIESFGTVNSNEFTSGSEGLQLVNSGIYYELRATISKKNRTFIDQLKLNFPNGRGLKMVEGVKHLGLYLVQDRSKPCSNVFIYDIKIKPLYLPFTQGYLGEKNIIASYYENNSSYSNTTVNKFIETYLISYRNILRAQPITSSTETIIYFKVISDRRVYIEGAEITVAGQTLTTNSNGEVSIVLYPGDYLYTVSKDKFIPIENEVLSVIEEDEQVVYVSLRGDLYERRVIFSVRDENNIAISGATVTFNGKFQNTGPDGTTVFMAYPDLYPYTVVKDKYYVVNKSVLVLDDMVENVTLELIPVSDITFIVKHGTEPVPGVQITLSSQQVFDINTPTANSTFIQVTDETGTAVFREVVNGKYNYTAEKIDWLSEGAEIDVVGDQTINIAFEPVPTYTVTFIINDYNPFTGERKFLQNANVTYAGMSKLSDAKGQASFVVKGNLYNYQISLNNYVTQEGSIQPIEDTTKTIDLPQVQYKTTIKVTGIGGAVIKGANVTIGGKIQQTDARGETFYDLPNGTYSYSVSATEYHTKTGNFTVSNSTSTVNVPLDQVLYNVTFTVKEENVISVGALVKFGDQSKTTSNQGIVVFQVPVGSYQWMVSKTIYVTQTGNIDVTGYAVTRDINLIRKNGQVTFYVRDDQGLSVEGATVICGGQTRSTNVSGEAVFTLPIASYSYDVSKLPNYTSQTGSINVTENPQRVNVLLSNKKYSVNFTVFAQTGSSSIRAYNVPVVFEGVTKYTDRNGQCSFTDIKNGYYSYSVANNSTLYQSKTGNVSVSNSDAPVEVSLTYITKESTVYVYRDGSRASGISVTGTSYYENGSVYASISGSTNSSGSYSFSVPAGGTFEVTTEDSLSINKSGSGYANGSTTIYLFKAWILSFNTSAQSIINSISALNSSNSEANGNTLKICPSYSGSSTPSNMYVSFSGRSSLLSVDQWPESWGLSYGSSMFEGCTSLSSVASGSPLINGNVNYMFKGCISLRSIPSALLSRVTGSQAESCFENCGLTDIGGSLFSSNITWYQYVFRNCERLTSVSGSPFGSGADFLGGVFTSCTSLSSVGANVFYNCDYATRIDYAFSGCTNLRNIPSDLFRYCTRLTSTRGAFSGCSLLQAVPANLFGRITTTCSFADTFRECTNLSSIGSSAFTLNASSFISCFKNCSSLSNINNFKRVYSRCQTAQSTFEGSGVTSIPGDLFYNWTSLTTIESCFKNCKSLTSIGSSTYGIVSNCSSLKNCIQFFYGCSNLTGVLKFTTAVNDPTLTSITTYAQSFYGCTKLGNVIAAFRILGEDVSGPLYTVIDLMTGTELINPVTTQGFTGCTVMINSLIPPPSRWQ